jgi:hypothetical protein
MGTSATTSPELAFRDDSGRLHIDEIAVNGAKTVSATLMGFGSAMLLLRRARGSEGAAAQVRMLRSVTTDGVPHTPVERRGK